MVKAYSKITWVNDKAPALNQTNLNKESTALDVVDTRVVELYNRVDNLEGFQTEAQAAIDKAQNIADKMATDAQKIANQMSTDASTYINQSKSWAIGEGYPQRTDQAINNSKYFADLAEQAAASNGYVHFYINDAGHLIYQKTTNVTDLDFEIRDNTNLFVVVDDGI